jgi:hypothetical protein
VAETVEHADPVHKISVIPRGIAALGYSQQQPMEVRNLLTRSELLDGPPVLLGGRVAEYGMSVRLGPGDLLASPSAALSPGQFRSEQKLHGSEGLSD